MSRLTDKADALVTAINGHVFTLPTVAVRRMVIDLTLPETTTRTIYVSPKGIETRWIGRRQREQKTTLYAVILARVATLEASVLDPLSQLTEDLDDFINATANRALGGATLIETKISALFDAERLRQQSLWASAIEATYQSLEGAL